MLLLPTLSYITATMKVSTFTRSGPEVLMYLVLVCIYMHLFTQLNSLMDLTDNIQSTFQKRI